MCYLDIMCPNPDLETISEDEARVWIDERKEFYLYAGCDLQEAENMAFEDCARSFNV